MNDYQLLYEDLLEMQRRAVRLGFLEFAAQCREFRLDLLDRYISCVGHVPMA